jgi:O-antigen ligase
MSVSAIAAAPVTPPATTVPKPAVRWLNVLIEGVVLILVCYSPWVFGSVHPVFEFVLYVGVALLLMLWGAAMVRDGQLSWQKCPVALGLAGLFLLGVFQLLPLPTWVLGVLSPSATATSRSLLPSTAEQVTATESAPTATMPAAETLSLYPGATRLAVLRLLAVFCLFAVVRNTIASSNALRRLALVAIVNGVALSLFALFQFFTTTRDPEAMRNTIYWNYETQGTVFGPFVNRNYFSFYVNICLGLGMGYVLYRLWRRSVRKSRDRSAGSSSLGLLQKPAAMWVLAGLAVILSAMLFSLSRGGFLALFLGSLLGLVVLWRNATRGSTVAIWLATGLLAFGLLSAFGLRPVEQRLTKSFWGPETKEGRWQIWTNCLPLLARFPVLGTGFGTFRYVEATQRGPGQPPELINEYAHNDYLEAAVEGGVVRLLLSLFLIGLIYYLGYRAYRRYRDHAMSGVVLGAMIAVTTVVVHSFVDFGLHVPAIAFFVTVLCAHIAGIGARRIDAADPVEEKYTVRLSGLAPVLGLGVLGLLGLVLVNEGWKLSQAERFRLAARSLALHKNPVPRDKQIEYLDTAVRFSPADADLQVALADAHFIVWEEQSRAASERAWTLSQAEGAFVFAGTESALGGAHPALTLAPAWQAAATVRETTAAANAGKEQGLLAAKHYLLARSLCPLLAQPHVRLAALAPLLFEKDRPAAYLRRATEVRPGDEHLWFLYGNQELADGDSDEASRLWRQSLACSERFLPKVQEYQHFLPEMVKRGGSVLTTEQWLDIVLTRPEATIDAAGLLYPDPDAVEQRRPFFEKALEQLENRGHQPGGMKAEDYQLRAKVQADLGQTQKAIESYEQALSRTKTSKQLPWRIEIAKLYRSQGKLKEAEEALRIVLNADPGNKEAEALLSAIKQPSKGKKD